MYRAVFRECFRVSVMPAIQSKDKLEIGYDSNMTCLTGQASYSIMNQSIEITSPGKQTA